MSWCGSWPSSSCTVKARSSFSKVRRSERSRSSGMPEPEMHVDSTAAGQDTRALEALFFVSDEPITASVLAQALDVDRRTVEDLCERLAKELDDRGSGLVLRNIAGGWRLYTHPDTAPVVEQFVLSSRQARLTKAALETLAIVAYKQPVTRHQISAIRGVNSDGVILARLGLSSLSALPSLAPLLGADPTEDDAADTVADATAGDGDDGEPAVVL